MIEAAAGRDRSHGGTASAARPKRKRASRPPRRVHGSTVPRKHERCRCEVVARFHGTLESMGLRTYIRRWRRRHAPLQGGGASVLGFGVSLPTAQRRSEREVLRELVIRLAERRVTSDCSSIRVENPWIPESVLAIRRLLTDALAELPESSAAVVNVEAMRAACNKLLTVREAYSDVRLSKSLEDEATASESDDLIEDIRRDPFLSGMIEFRETFRLQLTELAAEYELPRAREFSESIGSSMQRLL